MAAYLDAINFGLIYRSLKQKNRNVYVSVWKGVFALYDSINKHILRKVVHATELN